VAIDFSCNSSDRFNTPPYIYLLVSPSEDLITLSRPTDRPYTLPCHWTTTTITTTATTITSPVARPSGRPSHSNPINRPFAIIDYFYTTVYTDKGEIFNIYIIYIIHTRPLTTHTYIYIYTTTPNAAKYNNIFSSPPSRNILFALLLFGSAKSAQRDYAYVYSGSTSYSLFFARENSRTDGSRIAFDII